MVISKKMIRKLETAYRKPFPADLRNYLLAQYEEEPFPHEYSEQDLYENIRRDIQRYETGGLESMCERMRLQP